MQQGEAPIPQPGPAPRRTSRGRIVAAVLLLALAAAGLALSQVTNVRYGGPLLRDAQATMDMFQGRVVLRLAYYLEGAHRRGLLTGATGKLAGESARTGFRSAAAYFDKAARRFDNRDQEAAAAASAAAIYDQLGETLRALRVLQRSLSRGNPPRAAGTPPRSAAAPAPSGPATLNRRALSLLARLYANQPPPPAWLQTAEFRWIVKHAPAALLIQAQINERLGRPQRVTGLRGEMYDVGAAVAARVEVLLLLAVAFTLGGVMILGWGIMRGRGFGPYRGLAQRWWGAWEGLELVGAWLVLSLVMAALVESAAPRGTPLIVVVVVYYTAASAIALIWFVISVAPRGTGLRTVGWRGAGLRATLLNGVGAYAAAVPLLVAAAVIALRLLPPPPVNPLVAAMTQATDWGARALFLVLLCVVAPVVEETVFRGGLYGGFRQRWSLAPAALVSAAIFAAVHLNWQSFVPVMALGVALCVVYERTGSLLPAIVAHGLFNLATAAAVFAFA